MSIALKLSISDPKYVYTNISRKNVQLLRFLKESSWYISEKISSNQIIATKYAHSSKCSMLTHIQKCDCFHDIGSFQSIRLCWNVGKLPDGNHCHSQRIVVYIYQQKSTHPHMSECTNVKGVKTFERKCWDVVSNTLCWCPQRLLSPDIMVRNPTRLDTFWPVFSDNADVQWLKFKHSLKFDNCQYFDVIFA